VTSMCEDIDAALDELVRRSGVSRLVLLGIRLGGTLAALVAGRRRDVARLVLWEPLPRPWETLFQALRHTVAMQTIILGKVAFTREQIVENVLAGRPSLASGYNFNVIDDGFRLAAAFVRELQAVDLVAHPPAITAKTLILDIAKTAAPISPDLARWAGVLACEVEKAIVLCLPWVHEKVFARRFPAVFDATSSWLER
jgi:pimeloyl-ACP methyl ester carboxylesterase